MHAKMRIVSNHGSQRRKFRINLLAFYHNVNILSVEPAVCGYEPCPEMAILPHNRISHISRMKMRSFLNNRTFDLAESSCLYVISNTYRTPYHVVRPYVTVSSNKTRPLYNSAGSNYRILSNRKEISCDDS